MNFFRSATEGEYAIGLWAPGPELAERLTQLTPEQQGEFTLNLAGKVTQIGKDFSLQRQDRMSQLAMTIAGLAGFSLFVILCVGAAGAGAFANQTTFSWCVVGLTGGMLGIALVTTRLKSKKVIPVIVGTLLVLGSVLALGVLGGLNIVNRPALTTALLVIDIVGGVALSIVTFRQMKEALKEKRRLDGEGPEVAPRHLYERTHQVYREAGFVRTTPEMIQQQMQRLGLDLESVETASA